MNTSRHHHHHHLLFLLLSCLLLLVRPSESRRVTGTINLQTGLGDRSEGDDSSSVPRRLIVKSLVLSNGLDWGNWQPVEYCPEGTFAVSAEAKFEPYSILDTDETAVNAVKLYCSDVNGLPAGYVTSTEGSKGEWQGIRSCDSSYQITGMMARVLEPQGAIGDDVAVQNMKLECGYGVQALTLVENGKEQQQEELDKETKVPTGDWGAWSTCPADSAVCGIETRLEDPSLIVDDTGLTNISLFCCALNP